MVAFSSLEKLFGSLRLARWLNDWIREKLIATSLQISLKFEKTSNLISFRELLDFHEPFTQMASQLIVNKVSDKEEKGKWKNKIIECHLIR